MFSPLLLRRCRYSFFLPRANKCTASSRAAGRTYNETARAASFCVQEAPMEMARRQFLLLSASGEVFIEHRRARAGGTCGAEGSTSRRVIDFMSLFVKVLLQKKKLLWCYINTYLKGSVLFIFSPVLLLLAMLLTCTPHATFGKKTLWISPSGKHSTTHCAFAHLKAVFVFTAAAHAASFSFFLFLPAPAPRATS